jgi:hypothetical protein
MSTTGPPSSEYRGLLARAIGRELNLAGLQLSPETEPLLDELADAAVEHVASGRRPLRAYPRPDRAAVELGRAIVDRARSDRLLVVDSTTIRPLVAGRRCRYWPFCLR